MGTWDVGPFDNDTAANWCGGLHDADPAQRVELIRAALAAVADHGDDDLDSDVVVEAIAAAAIVASQLPGGTPITSPYAPDFLLAGGAVDVPDDVPSLALRALDRITADNSEWRQLWEEDPDSSRRPSLGCGRSAPHLSRRAPDDSRRSSTSSAQVARPPSNGELSAARCVHDR